MNRLLILLGVSQLIISSLSTSTCRIVIDAIANGDLHLADICLLYQTNSSILITALCMFLGPERPTFLLLGIVCILIQIIAFITAIITSAHIILKIAFAFIGIASAFIQTSQYAIVASNSAHKWGDTNPIAALSAGNAASGVVSFLLITTIDLAAQLGFSQVAVTAGLICVAAVFAVCMCLWFLHIVRSYDAVFDLESNVPSKAKIPRLRQLEALVPSVPYLIGVFLTFATLFSVYPLIIPLRLRFDMGTKYLFGAFPLGDLLGRYIYTRLKQTNTVAALIMLPRFILFVVAYYAVLCVNHGAGSIWGFFIIQFILIMLTAVFYGWHASYYMVAAPKKCGTEGKALSSSIGVLCVLLGISCGLSVSSRFANEII